MSGPEISSPSNATVKSLARLRNRRERDRRGLALVEGFRELGRAAEAGTRIESVIVCRALADSGTAALADRVANDGASLLELAEAPFRKLSIRQHPDGILGVVGSWIRSLDELALGTRPLVLVVDGVEKPGNLGAMLRTADAAGVDSVVIADPGTDPTNPNVIRASQGAAFAVAQALATSAEAIAWCQERELTVIAGAPAAGSTLWETDMTGPVAIVVGREDTGLGDQWRDAAHLTAIPMVGLSDSLNAAASAAVLLYEALRQRSTG